MIFDRYVRVKRKTQDSLEGCPNLNSTWYFRNHIFFLRTIWFSVAKPKQYIVFHPRYKIPHTMFRVPCTMSVHCYLSKTSSMYYVGFTFRNRQRTQYIVWCTRLNIVFFVVYQVENYVGSGTANTHQKNTIWCGPYHVLFRFGHPLQNIDIKETQYLLCIVWNV